MENTDGSSEEQRRGFVSMRQLMQRLVISMQLDQLGVSGGLYGPAVTLGYPDLDILLGGMRSNLIVISGHESVGKSTLALNICLRQARRGSRVALFNLDSSAEDIIVRVVSSEAEIDVDRLRMGYITPAEEQRIIESRDQVSGFQLSIDLSSHRSLEEILSAARKLKFGGGLDLLVVDPLQFVGENNGRGIDQELEIHNILLSLKQFAMGLEVPTIVCSRLDLLDHRHIGDRPQLIDLADPVAQIADIVIFIHREGMYLTDEEWEQQHPDSPYTQNLADIIVAKNRSGPTGTTKLMFHQRLMRFESYDQVNG